MTDSSTYLQEIESKMSDGNPWGSLEAQFVTTLRETRVEPVPEPIVKLAQRALDGAPHPTLTDKDDNPKLMHSMQIELDTEDQAKAFAAHMRNAGLHTKPLSSVTVKIDPERKLIHETDENGDPIYKNGKAVTVLGPPVNPKLVAFRAGARRGRRG